MRLPRSSGVAFFLEGGGYKIKCSLIKKRQFLKMKLVPLPPKGWREGQGNQLYQLDFTTPGKNPWRAYSRKTCRDNPKSR
jgi:hypothetical protein